MTNSLIPLGTSNENVPSKSVMVPVVVPLANIFAPITPSPVSSTTKPVTVLCAIIIPDVIIKTNNSNENFFISNSGLNFNYEIMLIETRKIKHPLTN